MKLARDIGKNTTVMQHLLVIYWELVIMELYLISFTSHIFTLHSPYIEMI